MADREIIAATLTAALLQKLDIPGTEVRSAEDVAAIDKVAVGRHAVSLYETILGMLPTSQP